ncbi:hypothetical protein I4U23_010625 [Adineta vaga]|nr:hypothetical protein I4U23_010625 [Adineta vaga]
MKTGSRTVLTSSCKSQREILLSKAFFSIKPKLIHDNCWKVLKCIIQMPDSLEPTMTNYYYPPKTECSIFCGTGICQQIIDNDCSEIIYIPEYPILNGHIYLAYNKSKLVYSSRPLEPTYVCYNETYVYVPNDGKTILLSHNRTCRLFADSNFGRFMFWDLRWLQRFIGPVGRWLHRVTKLINNDSTVYNQSDMYRCMNSLKMISKTQVFDVVKDCYYEDDEDLSKLDDAQSIEQFPNVFKCPSVNQYIAIRQVNDGQMCDCKGSGEHFCVDESSERLHFQKRISFQTICDKTSQLLSEFPGYENETDETNSNDGIINCLGAADEPTFCIDGIQDHFRPSFFCMTHKGLACIGGNTLCDGNYDCITKEDEEICQENDLRYPKGDEGICTQKYQLYGSIIAKVLCKRNNQCKHNGTCLQENSKCRDCYYRERCELTTNSFSLSLDAILNLPYMKFIVFISIKTTFPCIASDTLSIAINVLYRDIKRQQLQISIELQNLFLCHIRGYIAHICTYRYNIHRAHRQMILTQRILILISILLVLGGPYSIFIIMEALSLGHAPAYSHRIGFMFISIACALSILTIIHFTRSKKSLRREELLHLNSNQNMKLTPIETKRNTTDDI